MQLNTPINQVSQKNIRKPRIQSKLGGLSDPQKEQLFTWMAVEGLLYKEVIQKVQEIFGVKTSNAGLNGFWNQYCAPRLVKTSPAPTQTESPLLEILIQVLPRNVVKVSILKGHGTC